ncbi:hypothetical protein APS56_15470 [Pseudalgibacter alginicilyticus]|uniref:Uncharacterized protein n=1 Tax=Pseudalgibacter alginicilyticus TaxID=1736674 RepID=A0A0N7HYX2_9FLAO|nr:hypothetical protein [Pseudalgibacter alginicilyticus]ALJ06446.1 hypothetical protein APS56_15470 [Pseudalgibacter alginicilyticus]
MTNEIIIAITSTSFVWAIILLILLTNIKKKNIEILKNQEIDFEKEKNQILDRLRTEKHSEFNKGYELGTGESDFIVQVEPYKNTIGKKGYFQNSQVMEIGYIYRLFVKGIPSLDPHIQIVEKIKISDLNEQNVNSAIEKLDILISKIPSPHLRLVGNVKDFGTKILKSIKTKRK